MGLLFARLRWSMLAVISRRRVSRTRTLLGDKSFHVLYGLTLLG